MHLAGESKKLTTDPFSVMTIFLLTAALAIVAGIGIGLWFRSSGRTIPSYGRWLGLLLAVLGLVLNYHSSLLLQTAHSRLAWPTVKGIVERVQIVGEQAVRPNIVYTYSIDSLVVTDSTDLDQPPFGNKVAREDIAVKRSAPFAVGDTIDVWVNPDDHAESTLNPQPYWALYVQVGFAVLVIFAGLVLTIISSGLKQEGLS